jgi:hypothetical protein
VADVRRARESVMLKVLLAEAADFVTSRVCPCHLARSFVTDTSSVASSRTVNEACSRIELGFTTAVMLGGASTRAVSVCANGAPSLPARSATVTTYSMTVPGSAGASAKRSCPLSNTAATISPLRARNARSTPLSASLTSTTTVNGYNATG